MTLGQRDRRAPRGVGPLPRRVSRRDGLTVFAEDYDWKTEVGHIAAIQVNDAIMGSPAPTIRLATHLSYPYILEAEGQLYCVPESSQTNEVALYRPSEDRSAWTKAATLIGGIPIIDPTICEHGGRWWLFGTRADAGDNWKPIVRDLPSVLSVEAQTLP